MIKERRLRVGAWARAGPPAFGGRRLPWVEAYILGIKKPWENLQSKARPRPLATNHLRALHSPDVEGAPRGAGRAVQEKLSAKQGWVRMGERQKLPQGSGPGGL